MTRLLDMCSITKEFPGVKALDNVSMRVEEGEIHAICGENGAGKSTLMNVLSGVYPHGSYDGAIVWRGRPAAFNGIRASEAAGIVIIHQELALIPELSITDAGPFDGVNWELDAISAVFIGGAAVSGGVGTVVGSVIGGVPEQQNQISAMVTRGAKIIIVGAIDGSQLGGQLQEAEDAGALVIAYDRLLTNTNAVDYYVSYDNFKVGVLQGRALLEGLQQRKGSAPWHIELFAGSPDDANSRVFFDGAMSVLQPLITAGTLMVRSGQISFAKAATPGWKAENAQRRMDTLLAGAYARELLHGVLAPNDTLARAILTSARAAGKSIPVVTGQDSEVESIKSILRGEQYSTINKDTAALVHHTITMVVDIQQGRTPEINDDRSYHNGVRIVPAYLLEPQIVTLHNIRAAYINNPVLNRIVDP